MDAPEFPYAGLEKNTPESEPAIQIKQLRKVYRTGFWMNQTIESLKSCTLTVYRGETFGLLGQNGAGKTTLLKTLLGIVRPSGGTGRLLGEPLGRQQVKQRLGYLPENAYFYDYLTGWEFLEYAAGLFEIPYSVQRRRIPELLDMVGLDLATAKKKQLRQYSKGMLQRVGMAQVLVNDPELIFLDEPMSGLDPLGRYQLREIILSLKAAGKTIFFNSHVLSEVEQICDRIGILDRGELICEGALAELLGDTDTYQVRGLDGNLEVLRRWVPDLSFDEEQWFGHLQGEPQEFLGSLRLMGAKLIQINLARPTLEEFFVQQIQRRGIHPSS